MSKGERIWLSPPHMSGKELNYIREAFDENWIAPVGPHIDEFEKELSAYNKVRHACVLSSGTAAIHLALIMLGVGKDDEVLASSFTFSASVNPIVYQGATPILVDSEPDSWNMSPPALETAIADRIQKGRKPKAIVLVHLYGQPSKLTQIMAVAEKHHIPVIEDAAESLGATYERQFTGTFGAMGAYSFNGNKIITTSGGGALVSNNEAWINKAKFLSTQARDPAPHYQHTEIGYNYRMSNVLAGIGRAQLEVLEQRIARKRAIFEVYRTELSGYEGIEFQPELENSRSNRWLTCLTIDRPGLNEQIRKALEAENIESRPLWKPMHQQPIFTGCPMYSTGVSDALFANGLCLPSGSSLATNDQERIIKVIKKQLGSHPS